MQESRAIAGKPQDAAVNSIVAITALSYGALSYGGPWPSVCLQSVCLSVCLPAYLPACLSLSLCCLLCLYVMVMYIQSHVSIWAFDWHFDWHRYHRLSMTQWLRIWKNCSKQCCTECEFSVVSCWTHAILYAFCRPGRLYHSTSSHLASTLEHSDVLYMTLKSQPRHKLVDTSSCFLATLCYV